MRKQGATNWRSAIKVGLGIYFGVTMHAQAQRTYVREFSTAAVLMTTGDTLQGRMWLHTDENVLKYFNNQGAVKIVLAADVQLFAGSGENYRQNIAPASAVSNISSNRIDLGPPLNNQPFFSNSGNTIPGRYYSNNYLNMPPINTLANSSNFPSKASTQVVVVGDGANDVTLFRTCLVKMKEGGIPVPSFCEQLTNGPIMLLCRRKLHNRGKTRFYLARSVRTERATAELLLKPWKQIPSYFPEHSQQIKAYIKSNQLVSSNEQHIAALITYGNSLIANSAE